MTTLPPGVDAEELRSFIIAAHFNLERVKAVLADHPDWLMLGYPWKPDDVEDALGAAAHAGSQEVALFLLLQGAPLTIFAAAMLGYTDQVRDMLTTNPALIHAKGAHGISLLFHAAYSGSASLGDLLLERGISMADAPFALHAAIKSGSLEMVRWLLAHGAAADLTVKNFEGRTPLQKALEQGSEDIADELRAMGAAE